MHKSTRAHLERVETGGPDESASSGIALCFRECIVDGAIRNLVIALDVLSRYCVDFTAGRDSDSGVYEALHASHTRSIFEKSVPQLARSCTERGECAHAGDHNATLVGHHEISRVTVTFEKPSVCCGGTSYDKTPSR